MCQKEVRIKFQGESKEEKINQQQNIYWAPVVCLTCMTRTLTSNSLQINGKNKKVNMWLPKNQHYSKDKNRLLRGLWEDMHEHWAWENRKRLHKGDNSSGWPWGFPAEATALPKGTQEGMALACLGKEK